MPFMFVNKNKLFICAVADFTGLVVVDSVLVFSNI